MEKVGRVSCPAVAAVEARSRHWPRSGRYQALRRGGPLSIATFTVPALPKPGVAIKSTTPVAEPSPTPPRAAAMELSEAMTDRAIACCCTAKNRAPDRRLLRSHCPKWTNSLDDRLREVFEGKVEGWPCA